MHMSFCSKCGTEIFENESFCSKCGERNVQRERRNSRAENIANDLGIAQLRADAEKESQRELHDMAILHNVGEDVLVREAKYRGVKNLDESTKAKIAPVFNIGDKSFSQRYCPECDKRITETNETEKCTHCGKKFCESCAAKAKKWGARVGIKEIPVKLLDEYDDTMCKTCWKELREVVDKMERYNRFLIEQEPVDSLVSVSSRIPKEFVTPLAKFKLIPTGVFMMGGETGYIDSKHIHRVRILEPFYIGIYPVTQAEWKVIMGDNPSRFKGEDLPVENVSWLDCQKFIEKLNRKEKTYKYRLPTEPEWEYACRAGSVGKYCFGEDDSRLGQHAWYCENSGERAPKRGSYLGYDKDDWSKNTWGGCTHVVGTKRPNKWGLHDMHGNVWEWCEDKWHPNYIDSPTDGRAWITGSDSRRVLRGGSWDDLAYHCASAYRFRLEPGFRPLNLGLRLVRTI